MIGKLIHVEIQKRTIAHALLTLSLMGALCSYNWAYKYLEYIKGTYPPPIRKKSSGFNMKFAVGDHECRDSLRANVSPICGG